MKFLKLTICAAAALVLAAAAPNRALAQDKVLVGVFPVS